LQNFPEAAEWHAKMRATFGLDIRMPASDQRLFEFCIGIPEDQYLRKGCHRWLIRRAMTGRLPDAVLNQQKTGAQAADWYPRLTRARNEIAGELKRLAENPDVAAVLDMRRLMAILDAWPQKQPGEYSLEGVRLATGVPDALSTAYFIESFARKNYCTDKVLQPSNIQ
jgi:asparagine synthase (glutamine-hydrolysing)